MEYAERKLGVHDAYKQAQTELERYEDARQQLASVASALRGVREELADFEADLLTTARGENPEMSATAFDRHFKVLQQQNGEHRKLRREILRLQAEQDLAEISVKSLDRRIDVTVARLHELAGLLRFYAARSPRTP